jgi:beta-lactamase class A
MIRLFLSVLTLFLSTAVLAQNSAPLDLRAATVLKLLQTGDADAADFSPSFIEAVALDQVSGLAKAMRDDNGPALGIASITADSPVQGTIVIDYDKAQTTVRLAVESNNPHRIIGLLIAGVTRKGDTYQAVVDDLKKLPGKTALLVTRVDLPGAEPLAAWQPDVSLATGSTFKLFVLETLADEIAAGRKAWAQVVPLGPPSLPSGVTQDWPRGTPMTLQTLATQMISISDNTATDTLIRTVGKNRLDSIRWQTKDSPGAIPVLTTIDAFVLKMASKSALRTRWIAGDLAARRAVLAELNPDPKAINAREFAENPLHINSVEWPATMRELSAVLNRLRKTGSSPALDIMAINPSVAPDDRKRFAYTGYKGGSENGVIAMSWLVRKPNGLWYTVSAGWNNQTAPVKEQVFESLMARILSILGSS